MGVWNRLFNKNKAKEIATTQARPTQPTETKDNLKENIDQLWKSAEKLRWSDADCEKKVLIYTELLGLADVNSASHDMCAMLHNRALNYQCLKKYDAAIQDLTKELEICQKHDHWDLIGPCRNLLAETQNKKRKTEIEDEGGEKAARLSYMEEQAHTIRDAKPDAEAAFEGLFSDLENGNPDIRNEASRLLGDTPDAIERLISIYQKCLISDPRRASLAGRVLGRKIAKGANDIILPLISKIWYGIAVSFIPSTCVYCGHLNNGIAAPPNAPHVPYFHSKNDERAYAVQVLCDKCGSKFFVVWDEDPR